MHRNLYKNGSLTQLFAFERRQIALTAEGRTYTNYSLLLHTERLEMRIYMYKKWDKELESLKKGTSGYVWDELEELITDSYEEQQLTDEQFDQLMEKLMAIDCE